KWCCRISNHGEYIHENEENRANIGKRNTSHGCINLFEADAKDYFDSALLGDPVEITGSKADFPTTSAVWAWLVDWECWRKPLALRPCGLGWRVGLPGVGCPRLVRAVRPALAVPVPSVTPRAGLRVVPGTRRGRGGSRDARKATVAPAV